MIWQIFWVTDGAYIRLLGLKISIWCVLLCVSRSFD